MKKLLFRTSSIGFVFLISACMTANGVWNKEETDGDRRKDNTDINNASLSPSSSDSLRSEKNMINRSEIRRIEHGTNNPSALDRKKRKKEKEKSIEMPR